jgi:cytochrome oxidase assembly protein ShyY1
VLTLADTVDDGMYGFLLRPKWLGFHLLVVLGVVVMVSLGMWQLRRLDDRQEFNATVEARFDVPAVPLDDLLAEGPPDDVEWRQAVATGTYLPAEQFVVVNRSQSGRAGQNVVTPLQLDDGRVLVVNRGFVPLGEPPPPAPDGTVTVLGRARPSEERRTGQLSDPAEGDLTEVQRIDLDRLAAQLPGEVVPVYLDRLESEPAETGELPVPVAPPELGEGPHLSYAVQWFIFAACVVVGWVLAVRRSVAANRRRLSAPAPARAVEDPLSPVGGAPPAAPNGTRRS